MAIPSIGSQGGVTKTFRRAQYSGDDAMVAAAVEWRDGAWQAHFGNAVPTRSFHQTARLGSSTGVPGVRYVEKTVRKGAKKYIVPCVVAEIHATAGRNYARPSGSLSRVFSLNKFDFDEAIALAAAWRAEMVAKLTV